MERIVKLLVLAALLYFGYTKALPWIEARSGSLGLGGASESSSSADDESLRCLRLAERANDTFSSVVAQFSRPPVNQQEWTSAFLTVSGEIGSAEAACACGADGCAEAAEAMSELRDLALSFDGMARGAARGMGNPATQQLRIEDLLDEARRLAG